MSTTNRGWWRLTVAATIAGIAVLGLAAPALAHVEADGEQEAGGDTTVTFSFTHGCAGSPTTSLKIQLPANASEVKATEAMPGFTANVIAAELDWTGGSVPDTTEGKFVATMKLTGTSGETVFFPTVQGCATGEETWIEKTEDAEAEHAAPRVTLTQTVAGGSTTASAGGSATTAATTGSASPATTEAASSSTSSSNNTALWVVGGVIVAIIVIGGIVLIVRKRSSAA